MTVTLTQGGIVSGGAAPATSGAGRRTDALPAPSVELSIIVLNYRTPRLLEQCLHGILGLRTALGPEVIVVDNGSADGSLEMVAERFPQVTHIASPVNLGYAAGNNLALRRSRGRCVLVMNTDVVLPEGALDELCRYLSEHPSAGLVAPRLVNPDGTTQLSVARFPSFWMPLWRRTPLGYLPLPRRAAARYMMTDWDHRDSRTVGWAMGACLLIRREALETVGLFDEGFFLYLEDVDLCRRLWTAGWEVHYDSAVEVVHLHRRLSAGRSPLIAMFTSPVARAHVRSWLRYFAKYRGAPRPPHSL